MGIGGAPEGVITAAALRCLNGEIQGRLIVKDEKQAERMRRMGIADAKRVYRSEELASARNMVRSYWRNRRRAVKRRSFLW